MGASLNVWSGCSTIAQWTKATRVRTAGGGSPGAPELAQVPSLFQSCLSQQGHTGYPHNQASCPAGELGQQLQDLLWRLQHSMSLFHQSSSPLSVLSYDTPGSQLGTYRYNPLSPGSPVRKFLSKHRCSVSRLVSTFRQICSSYAEIDL